MDPISAIVAALVAGAAEAAKPTVVQAVKDAYDGLKALISRKFGGTSTPVQSVEEKPASQTRQQVLKEELTDAHADQDPEVIQGLNALLEALRQHAPQSVSHITTTIQSGGGAVVQGNVNTGGGAFVGRDQVINNITLHSVDQIGELTAVLRASLGRLVASADPDALDLMGAVLDEISKLYQLIDTEMTRYLSLTLDDAARDREVLLSLDGGLIAARASEARGHCTKIDRIYRSRLRDWFQSTLDATEMNQVERSFAMLSSSDVDMTYAIHRLAEWLSAKATATLDLVDKGDIAGAKTIVKGARADALPMRQKVARTISAMRDIQAELLRF